MNAMHTDFALKARIRGVDFAEPIIGVLIAIFPNPIGQTLRPLRRVVRRRLLRRLRVVILLFLFFLGLGVVIHILSVLGAVAAVEEENARNGARQPIALRAEGAMDLEFGDELMIGGDEGAVESVPRNDNDQRIERIRPALCERRLQFRRLSLQQTQPLLLRPFEPRKAHRRVRGRNGVAEPFAEERHHIANVDLNAVQIANVALVLLRAAVVAEHALTHHNHHRIRHIHGLRRRPLAL